MPVQIPYTTPVSGAVASYHVVRTAMQDFAATKLTAQIASYVDKSTYDAQKQPVFIQAIEWPSLPASGGDVRLAVETLLVADASDASSPTASRVSFAGGAIVDSTIPVAVSAAEVTTTESDISGTNSDTTTTA